MKKKVQKLYLQQKRRYLKKIIGTSERPRLSVFRSHKHIYGQLIDDSQSKTLVSCSTLEKALNLKNTSTQAAAFSVGETLAQKALNKEIQFVVFDRNHKPYHGRIRKLAEGARSKGLLF